MQCPMCGGPLSLRHPMAYACERGHQLHPVQLQEAAAVRVSLAYWGAIEALESRAEILSSLDMGRTDAAKNAMEDADILRRLAMRNACPNEPGTEDDHAGVDEHSAKVTELRSPSAPGPGHPEPADPLRGT